MHSDKQPFACQLCGFRTKRRDKLKRHLVRAHAKGEAVPALHPAESAAAQDGRSLYLQYVAAKRASPNDEQ